MDPSFTAGMAAAVHDILAILTSATNIILGFVAESTFADYFTILAVFIFLRNRRNDDPTPDDSDWGTTKNSLSFLVLLAEFCRYFLPVKYIWQNGGSTPVEEPVASAIARLTPSFMPIVAAFCNLVLIGFEPLHGRVPTPLPTLTLLASVTFRCARYLVLEEHLHSYYSDLSLVILSMQCSLLAVQVFWKVAVFTPSSPTGEPQSPIWRKIAPGWFATMFLLQYFPIDSIEQLDKEYAAPRAYGAEPLFCQSTPLRDGTITHTRHPLAPFGFFMLRRQFLIIVPPRLLLIVFTYSIPYLVQDTVAISGQKPTLSQLYNIVGLTVLLFGGKMLSTAWYQQNFIRFSTSLRNTMVNAMSEKLLVISQKDAQKFNLVKLFSRDVDEIDAAAHAFHDMWSSILELAFGIYTVTSLSGCSAYMAIFCPLVVIVCEPIVTGLTTFSHDWRQAVKARVATAFLYIDQYPELRYTGYINAFIAPLMALRRREIETATREQTRRSMTLALYATAKAAAPVAIIGTALFETRQSNPLTIPEYFAIGTVALLIIQSFRTLTTGCGVFFSGLHGLGRTQEFMALRDLTPKDRGHPGHPSGSRARSLQLLQTCFKSPSSTTFRYRDLRFDAGKVTMVIGPAGCGKSSLLKALLGEMQLASGKVIAPHGPIAFCGEAAFIQNLSIKDNIVFQATYDPIWYQRVLHACTLNLEVQKLPLADETKAGEAGCSIRDIRHLVALARAVYANLPVMILDETFDYFDPKTANIILGRLFGQGGLLRQKCTAVFSSTTSRDSSHADAIFAFNEIRGIQEVSRSRANLPAHLKFDPNAFNLGPMHDGTRPPLDLREQEYPYVDNTAEGIRSDLEAEKTCAVSLITHLAALGTIGVSIAMITAGIAALSVKLPLIYLQRKLENYNPQEPTAFYFTWAELSVAPLIIVPLCSAVYYLTSGSHGSFIWHIKLIEAMNWTDVSFITKYSSSKIRKLHEQDLALVATTLSRAYLIGTFMTIGMIADLYLASYNFGLIGLLLAILGLLIVFGMGMSYAGNYVDLRVFDFDRKVALYNHLLDSASGVEHIRSFGWERHFLQRTFELLDKSQRSHYYLLLVRQSLSLSLDLLALIAASTAICFPLLFELGTQASMGVSLITIVSLSQITGETIDSWMALGTALTPAHHLGRFIVEAPKPKKRAASTIDAADRRIHWPLQGGIKFHNVTADYEFRAGTRAVRILEDINVTIEAGKTVGIIGTTASGKTAFLSAILGLLDYTGTITIDGTDVRQLADSFVQQRIITVTANLLEFPGSLRENLDPLCHTRHRVRLPDADFVDVLNKVGLFGEVARNGATLDSPMSVMALSRGQLEVFAIARAILRQRDTGAKIIMIDGVMGVVDNRFSQVVNRVMKEAFRGCTLIKVTHRLATLDDAAQVIKIEEGRIESVFQPSGGGR